MESNINNGEKGMNIFDICSQFGITAVAKKVISKGLINSSWEVTDKAGKTYIVQGINNNVFKDVDGLMDNITRVTNHIREKVLLEGGDTSREVLELIPNVDTGKNYINVNNKEYYRIYKCITNATTYDEANMQLLYQAGIGFGKFQKQLDDFPAESLTESIPNFHNTPKRFEAFEKKLEEVDFKTYSKAKAEIIKALKGYEYAKKIMEPLENGEIPTRVVHNDTKLNNVMLDNTTHKAVCVIDLDTIMPGSLLFDYGDAIRYCSNTGAEDEQDLSQVHLDPQKFMAFTHGFLQETHSSITTRELDLMAVAPAVLTYELALRFLTDYLDGNKYFKCDPARPEHNLERARAQLKLLDEFKANEKNMNKSIHHIFDMCEKNDTRIKGHC